MFHRILLFSCIVLASFTATAQAGNFDFNQNCRDAYKQFLSLNNEEAAIILKKEIKHNPDNIIPYYLEDYGDCLSLLFNGDPQEYAALKKNEEARLKRIAAGEDNSPWYRFCLANIHFRWALVHLRFGEQYKAAIRFRKSFLLLKENQKSFPKFEENKVLFGLEKAMAGAVPENYKWIGSLLGVKGEINKGVTMIAQYLNANPNGEGALQEEAMIYYVYLKFYLQNQPAKAWNFLKGKQFEETNNLLRSFIKANIALNYRKAEIAKNILLKAFTVKGFEQYPILQYELAEAKLMQLDFDCIGEYQSFLNSYKGGHFVKDAWLKMAWMAYFQNNQIQANSFLASVKTEGKSLTDADKQAARFAANPAFPLPALLRVRLLIDGGYYAKAKAEMQGIDKNKLNVLSQRLEYNFRYGRIFEELGNDETAIIFYTATIAAGRNEKDYYAARAALHKAFIAERNDKKEEAIAQFKDCLSMRHHDLQSSIDQQAKAGLNRLAD